MEVIIDYNNNEISIKSSHATVTFKEIKSIVSHQKAIYEVINAMYDGNDTDLNVILTKIDYNWRMVMQVIFKCITCQDYNKHHFDDTNFIEKEYSFNSFSEAFEHMSEYSNIYGTHYMIAEVKDND